MQLLVVVRGLKAEMARGRDRAASRAFRLQKLRWEQAGIPKHPAQRQLEVLARQGPAAPPWVREP